MSFICCYRFCVFGSIVVFVVYAVQLLTTVKYFTSFYSPLAENIDISSEKLNNTSTQVQHDISAVPRNKDKPTEDYVYEQIDSS